MFRIDRDSLQELASYVTDFFVFRPRLPQVTVSFLSAELLAISNLVNKSMNKLFKKCHMSCQVEECLE